MATEGRHSRSSYSPTAREELRYQGLPWWNAGAGRLYPLEKIYYYHTLKEFDEDSPLSTLSFDSMTI